jgi:type IV pilus assembly protein PilC
MEQYKYVRQDRKGGPYVTEVIEADSLQDAERMLLSRQVPVLSIEKILPKGVKKKRAVGIKLKQNLMFANQMKSAMKIELGLLRAVDLCKEQSIQKSFVGVLQHMRDMIEQGQTLHEAMRATGSFDPLVLGLVRAGEGTGDLGGAFEMIGYMFKRESTIRRKIIKVLSLPAITIVIAAVCVFFLMWKTIPQFVALFKSMGADLPLPTKILIAVSDFTAAYPWAVALGIVGMILFFLNAGKLYRKLPWLHAWLLKIPVFGGFQKKLIQETFSRTYLSMVATGDVPILVALGLCRGVSPCYPYRAALARAMVSISIGGTLSAALEPEKDIFGFLLVRSIGFGDDTGKTADVLKPLADELSEEVMDFVDNLSTILEPMMTVFIASIVLVIMLALFIPIFSLPNLI